jgi:uncharacterized protein YggE
MIALRSRSFSSLVLVSAVAGAVACAPAMAQQPAPGPTPAAGQMPMAHMAPQPMIVTSGQGETKITPDRA